MKKKRIVYLRKWSIIKLTRYVLKTYYLFLTRKLTLIAWNKKNGRY